MMVKLRTHGMGMCYAWKKIKFLSDHNEGVNKWLGGGGSGERCKSNAYGRTEKNVEDEAIRQSTQVEKSMNDDYNKFNNTKQSSFHSSNIPNIAQWYMYSQAYMATPKIKIPSNYSVFNIQYSNTLKMTFSSW
jgi:hypothetical protein